MLHLYAIKNGSVAYIHKFIDCIMKLPYVQANQQGFPHEMLWKCTFSSNSTGSQAYWATVMPFWEGNQLSYVQMCRV